MTDLRMADVAAKVIAGKRKEQAARDAVAAANRAAFPFAAGCMAACAVFSPRLRFAREDGRTIGKEPFGKGIAWYSKRGAA